MTKTVRVQRPVMRPCRFVFDYGPVWAGFAHGSTWNGFDNVAVDKPTRDAILAWMRTEGMSDDIPGFEEIAPMPDGLYSLGWGYSTQIVSPWDENDLLRNAGAPPLNAEHAS